jgi:hypothetical protein
LRSELHGHFDVRDFGADPPPPAQVSGMVDAGFHVVKLASGVFVLAGNLDLSRTVPDAVWLVTSQKQTPGWIEND